MNESDFNNRLKSIAPDMRLLFHPVRKVWGVYQIRRSTLILPNDVNPDRPWLLWDCVDEDKRFRLPDMRDLQQASYSTTSAHKMWEKGGDWYADKITEQENKREEKRMEKQRETVHEVTKDAFALQNIVRIKK